MNYCSAYGEFSLFSIILANDQTYALSKDLLYAEAVGRINDNGWK